MIFPLIFCKIQLIRVVGSNSIFLKPIPDPFKITWNHNLDSKKIGCLKERRSWVSPDELFQKGQQSFLTVSVSGGSSSISSISSIPLSVSTDMTYSILTFLKNVTFIMGIKWHLAAVAITWQRFKVKTLLSLCKRCGHFVLSSKR